jgi:hypothetical protein
MEFFQIIQIWIQVALDKKWWRINTKWQHNRNNSFRDNVRAQINNGKRILKDQP